MDENKIISPDPASAADAGGVAKAGIESADDLSGLINYGPEGKKRKIPKKVKRFIGYGILAVVVIAVGIWVYRLFNPEPPETPTSCVSMGTLGDIIEGAGPANPKEIQEIPASARGVVQEIYVSSGDRVEPGDPLFRVDTTTIQEQIDTANDDYENAREALDDARKKVENLVVKAPFKGKVSGVDLELGDTVADGSIVARFFDDSKMKLRLDFSHAYIDILEVGMEAGVSIPQSQANIVGKITEIERIDKISPQGAKMFEVEITFDNPGTITEGMLATAVINTDIGEVMPYDTGTLKFNRDSNIMLKAAGEIVSLRMRNYYSFEEGETLMVLENDAYATTVIEREKDLQTARDKFQEIEKEYKYYNPVAEISGTVMMVSISEGDEITVSTSGPLMTIANMSVMRVSANIDELDVSKVRVGMPVEVTTDSGGYYSGVLASVSSQGNAEYGVAYFPAVIEIYDNTDLLSSMYVNYRIIIAEERPCLVVPISAVKYTEQGTVVYLKGSGAGREIVDLGMGMEEVPVGFVPVAIEIGDSDTQNFEVITGLEEGDEIASGQNQDMYGYYW